MSKNISDATHAVFEFDSGMESTGHADTMELRPDIDMGPDSIKETILPYKIDPNAEPDSIKETILPYMLPHEEIYPQSGTDDKNKDNAIWINPEILKVWDAIRNIDISKLPQNFFKPTEHCGFCGGDHSYDSYFQHEGEGKMVLCGDAFALATDSTETPAYGLEDVTKSELASSGVGARGNEFDFGTSELDDFDTGISV